MGIDLRRDMHVRARRSGARGVVLRHWRHTNGHIWAEVRFVNGDTATVRSTHLERITLTEEEQRELSSQSAGSLTDPLELMQRTIDRSIKVTGDCGTEITNAFDEILKPDGTPLTEAELRTERGKPVVDEPLDEEKARRKAQAAREGRATTRSRQLEVRYAGEHEPGIVIISCNVCRRRGASRHEWRVALDSNGVMDGTALHKIRSHCGQFASVRHASTLEHCVALGRLTGRVFSQRASDASRLPAKRSYKAAVPVVRKQATTTPSRPAKRSRPSKRALAAEEAANKYLLSHLRDKQCLIVLDDLSAADGPFLAGLLAHCHQVQMLGCMDTPLEDGDSGGRPGDFFEHIVRVGPMSSIDICRLIMQRTPAIQFQDLVAFKDEIGKLTAPSEACKLARKLSRGEPLSKEIFAGL